MFAKAMKGAILKAILGLAVVGAIQLQDYHFDPHPAGPRHMIGTQTDRVDRSPLNEFKCVKVKNPLGLMVDICRR